MTKNGNDPAAPAVANPRRPEISSRMRRTLRLDDRREPKVGEIAEWIAIGVVEGDLAPGQDLNSVDLAKRFGTSRTPVREALMLLEQEGLVSIQARRRPRVAVISASDISDIYEVRADLLARMVRLVVERASDEQLRDLGSWVDQLRAHAKAKNVDSYFWTHVALQEQLAEIARNRVLKQILDSLALRTLVLRHRSISRPGRLQASLVDQVRLYEAISGRDADLAAAIIAGATRAAQRAIEDGFSPEPANA
jgi:DNA-binding GntR family transcriptional regulator